MTRTKSRAIKVISWMIVMAGFLNAGTNPLQAAVISGLCVLIFWYGIVGTFLSRRPKKKS